MSIHDEELKAALDARKGDWPAVAHDAGVSYSWLTKYAAGKIGNPGYATLVKLRDALKAPKKQEA